MKNQNNNLPILGREEILAVDDLQVEYLEVPEWGGAVYVRGMTGTERDKFESSIIIQRGKEAKVDTRDIRAKMAALCICDEKGNNIFTPQDIAALGKKSVGALQRVYAVAQRLSAITDEDIEELAEEMDDDPFLGSNSD